MGGRNVIQQTNLDLLRRSLAAAAGRVADNGTAKLPAVALIGPTATGKTSLALSLADLIENLQASCEMGIALINMDSVQVYKELEIGSAKPDFPERARFELMDLVPPNQIYSVARFVKDAQIQASMALQNNRLPVFVGGSMMYYHALSKGLSTLPASNPAIRSALAEQLRIKGYRAMLKELYQIDPALANRLSANDSQRLLRGLEVFAIAGVPLTQLQQGDRPANPFMIAPIAVNPDKRLVYRHIHTRLKAMFDAGLVTEVADLSSKYTTCLDLPAFRSVGYRQVLDMLAGRLKEDDVFDAILYATRQLAKRQRTWLNRWPNAFCISTANFSEQLRQLVTMIAVAGQSWK